MKILLTLALLAVDLRAGELDPRVFRLIGPDTKWIVAVDLNRHRSSALRAIAPVSDSPGIHYVMKISGAPWQDAQPLFVDIGPDPPAGSTGTSEWGDAAIRTTRLASNVSVAGDRQRVQEALQRWSSDEPLGELAVKAQRLSRTYDNWFLAIRPLEPLAPLEQLAPGESSKKMKYRDELVQAVEEASSGIRFGSVNELRAEVLMKTAEDAAALAAFGKWLPGLLQLKDGSVHAQIVELVENLSIESQGRTASISFLLSERKLEEFFKTASDAHNRANEPRP
jgi:hypothetical protein